MKIKALLFGAIILFLINLTPHPASAEAEEWVWEVNAWQTPIVLRYDEVGEKRPFIPPPPAYRTTAPTSDIQVNYLGVWPIEPQAAFEYAVSIWESQLQSTVPIVVEARFESLGSGIVGSAGPTSSVSFSSGNGVFLNTDYPIALANALADQDFNDADPEIFASFSSDFDFYFGTDGNVPNSQIDFVTVVLHELGHGLGFTGSMRVSGGTGQWGVFTGNPNVFDLFVENGNGQRLITDFPNNSSQLAAQLTSGDLFFNGMATNSANGNGRASLYAPSPWIQGSSLYHLDETTFNGTISALMTPFVSGGEAQHAPGDVALGMMEDMGWEMVASPIGLDIKTYLPFIQQQG